MKVSVAHVSQTNNGNTDSLLLYQNPSSQTTQYCTGVSDPVVYRLETDISNIAQIICRYLYRQATTVSAHH